MPPTFPLASVSVLPPLMATTRQRPRPFRSWLLTLQRPAPATAGLGVIGILPARVMPGMRATGHGRPMRACLLTAVAPRYYGHRYYGGYWRR